SEKFENNLQLSFFTNDALQFEDQPRLISKKDRHLIHNANSLKFFNVIKLSLKVDYDKYLIIFLTRKKERVLLSPSDLELTKSLKIYLDLLLKNQMLYKQIQQIKDDLFLTFKNLPIGIIILNNEMFIKSVNTQALLLLKYNDEKELIGKQLGGAIYIFPDLKIYEKIRKGEYLLFHKTQLSSKTLEIKQIELTITPLKDEYNNVIGRILSFNDITELKELEEELQRRDKLAALGQMTAGLAHEFRNPLAIIEGFASLLQKDLATDPEKYKLASKLVEGVNDLNRIVSEFLNFTNKIQLAPEARNIIDTIDRSLLFIRKMIEDNKIELIKNYNNFTKVIIEYDENKIKQVLLNILLNAIDALSEITAPQIVISLRLKDDYLANTSLFCIDIFNNGGNIDETIKNNIFNPFFTTKPSGIGLGLTISQKIVNEHNGKLYFKNEKNGVKFTIELPVDKRFVYKS
ncbi:MAG TPA: ATP-binding protein, partial [bacterium]|nr:ATP-binding protein [bacterium]